MSKRIKIKRRRHFHKKCSVLIAKPHNVEYTTDERTNNFIMRAFERGLAEYAPIESKLPELARNKIIDEFLHEPKYADKTHIFFLDDDSPPIDQFAIEYLRQQDKPVACGVTPIAVVSKDNVDCKWSAAVEGKDGEIEMFNAFNLPKKPFMALRVGGTCMLIKRQVLQMMQPPYQRNTFDDKYENIILSEDIYFAEKIRKETGFPIWVYPEIQCHHYHKFDILDLFSAIRQVKEGNEI